MTELYAKYAEHKIATWLSFFSKQLSGSGDLENQKQRHEMSVLSRSTTHVWHILLSLRIPLLFVEFLIGTDSYCTSKQRLIITRLLYCLFFALWQSQKLMQRQQTHNSIFYSYSLLHSSYMFRRYITPSSGSWHKSFYKTYSNKIGYNRPTYVVISIVQTIIGFG
jgi:hypothetical protein